MKPMKFIKSSLVALGAAATLLPGVVMAQGNPNSPFTRGQVLVNNVSNSAGITSSQDLPTIIGRIINVLLTFLGIIFLILLLYAGFLWMTAQGEEKQVDKARAMIKQSIIGMVVIVAGYAISNFVLVSLVNVTS
jgi:hypothetical protein